MNKTIIFDFGGVLGSDIDNWKQNIINYTGLSRASLQEIYNSHDTNLVLGIENLDDLLRDICIHSKNSISFTDLKEIYKANISINHKVLTFAKSFKEITFPSLSTGIPFSIFLFVEHFAIKVPSASKEQGIPSWFLQSSKSQYGSPSKEKTCSSLSLCIR